MKYIVTALICASALSLVGCSSGSSKKKEDPGRLVTNTSTVPAAQGRVDTSLDKNGNTNLNINVRHLAEPGAISPGANAYVVWVQPAGTDTYQNVGTLKVNKNLEGNYKTNVPYQNFKLIITPESNTMSQAPTGITVLEKTVNL